MSDPENAVQAKLFVVGLLVLFAFPFLFVWFHVRNFVRWLTGQTRREARREGRGVSKRPC